MKPLKPEIDAAKAVLMTPLSEFLSERESSEHKDPEGLAQTRMFTRALEAAEEARGSRTTYTVVLRFGTGNNVFFHAYGPYSTQAQAQKALEGDLAAFGPSGHAVVPTTNQTGLRARIEALDARPERRERGKKQEQELKSRMAQCTANERTHIRPEKGDRQSVKVLGNAWDLHAKEKR